MKLFITKTLTVGKLVLCLCIVALFVDNCIVKSVCSWQSVSSVFRSSGDQPVFADNQLIYLYLVGVEGVGHHALSPALKVIAESCGSHVVYQDRSLRMSHLLNYSASFDNYIARLRYKSVLPKTKLLLLEDASFPSGLFADRNSSSAAIKRNNRYSLVWLYNRLIQYPFIKVKFLYLSRDTFRTVNSHRHFDGSFEAHATVLQKFVQHLHNQFEVIEQNRMDSNTGTGTGTGSMSLSSSSSPVWGQVQYEWLTSAFLQNEAACYNAVSTIATFLEFILEDCDLQHVCKGLAGVVRKENQMVGLLNSNELAFVRNMNISLPIPFLHT
jgi:hypothetical protein